MKLFRIKSLNVQFLLLALTSLLFFIAIVSGAYYKLTGYASLFLDVTDSSMPKLVRMANIHSNIKELSHLVQELSEKSSNIGRKITYQYIQEIFTLIKNDELSIFKNQDFNIKIQVIEEHFEALNLLVKQKNIYAKKMRDKIELFSREERKILIPSQELDKIMIFINSVELYELHKKTEFNSFINEIKHLFAIFKEKIGSRIDGKSIKNIEDILFASDGFVEIKKKELDMKIKIKRLNAIVGSLLHNFAGEIELLSFNHKEELISNSKEFVLSMKKDLNILLLLFFIYSIGLFVAAFYLKRRVIDRLVRLDKNILQKIEGRGKLLVDNYEDEISYITKSFNYYAVKIEEQNQKLEELSLTDSLTKIANRRMFDIQFERELNFVQRNRYESSILLIDVDNFKLYNDNYGHLEGDRCLQILADVFKKITKRDTDIVARYGGEEFVFILSNSNKENSKKFAKTLLQAVEDLQIKHEYNGNRGYITISIGIVTINYGNVKSGKINLENADKALYFAKEKGKNIFIHYEDCENICLL